MNFYFTIIGCTPKNRLIEQHDVFFGMANQFKELVPSINNFWPECDGVFHIDSWRKVEYIENYKIDVVNKGAYLGKEKIFFINLGGYLPNDMEEYHFKTLLIAKSKSEAIKKVKQTEFYKKFSFKGAASHIDDQYGVDIDEIFEIEDILLPEFKDKYSLQITETESYKEDQLHVGYLSLSKLLNSDF